MIERFVQIETGLPNSKLIDRAREALGISMNEAIGMFVRLWLAALGARTRGYLADRSNTWIEDVAGWRGEPGVFGQFVRDYHLDEDGVIRDWLAKYGKLDEDRGKATELKRDQRRRAKEAEGQATVQGVSGGQSDGQTGDSPSITSIYQSPVSDALTQEQGQRDLDRERGDRHPAVEKLRERFGEFAEWPIALVRSARYPDALAATIVSHLDGMEGVEYTPAEVAWATREYIATALEREGFKARLFAGYCRRARKTLSQNEVRKQGDREDKFIAVEQRERTAFDAEERARARQIEQFATEHPERYAELREAAERSVPAKWQAEIRAVMVRAALVERIAQEVRRAS